MCAPRFARAKVSTGGPRTLLEEFSYADVSMNPGVMSSLAQEQFEQTQSVLLGMNEDSLLKPWRLRAGLPAPGPDMGGWYDEVPGPLRSDGHGFAPGHAFGQWISALSRGYAVTGDGRIRAKVCRLLTLYGPAISRRFYEKFRFPAYDYDKMVIGLIDAHRYARAEDAFALLDRTTDAAEPHLPHHALDRNAPQLAWRASVGDPTAPDYGWDESYTMPENLWIAAELGAGERYRRMAPRYLLDKTWFDPLAENRNVLDGRHAYSFCNSMSSAMRTYLATGEEKYLRAGRNGFDMIDLPITAGFPSDCKACKNIDNPGFARQNAREIVVAMRLPKSTPIDLELATMSSAIRRITLETTDLSFTRTAHGVRLTIPAQFSDRVNSGEFQTHLYWQGVELRFEHADVERRAGLYSTGEFPILQREAAGNLEFELFPARIDIRASSGV